jgi:SAM-dependent methyltransferase
VSDEQTLRVYGEKATEYAALVDAESTDDPTLQAFIAAVPGGGHVLDLGCGPGAAAAQMARAGLSVDAYDLVPEMVVMANRHEGVQAKVASFDDVSGIAVYDGIWANFSLLHAPRDALPKHLARIAQVLKPGGIFHIAVKTGSGSHRDGLGRLYTYYSEQELTGLLQEAGMIVIGRHTGEGKGLAGDVSAWTALLAHA